MSLFQRTLSGWAFAAAALLSACGGGGGSAGSTGVTTEPPSNLALVLSAATVNNSGSETITATVTATNANNQTLPNAAVVLKVDSGAAIAVGGTVTDSAGRLTGTVSLGSDRANRTVTVTATANGGALSVSRTFQVVGAKLTATAVPTVLAPSAAGAVKYRLLDANSNPMTDVDIKVTGPGGVESAGKTSLNGDFDYAYTAPTTTGDLTIKASAGGSNLDVIVVVQPSGVSTIPVVNQALTPIRSASMSANPSVVAVNSANTSNQSQLRALFLTEANAPVKNVRVRFDLAGDANSIGGTFSTGTNLVYSDANGVVQGTYVPGTRSSPTDGVTVRACWDYADFAVGTCPNAVTTTLTVVADPVSISIGTNNLLAAGASGLTYVKRYVVQVVDSSGVAKPDVQITPSIDLPQYFKGEWVLSGDKWLQEVRASCDNEDLNRNNVAEVFSPTSQEDANRSFNLTPGRPALEPRKADVTISFEGASKTDSGGSVIVKIEYPQDLGSWVSFNLLVAASGVSGTEGRASYAGILPVLASATTDKNVAPPFVRSPYGILAETAVTVTNPQGVSGQLCTNPN